MRKKSGSQNSSASVSLFSCSTASSLFETSLLSPRIHPVSFVYPPSPRHLCSRFRLSSSQFLCLAVSAVVFHNRNKYYQNAFVYHCETHLYTLQIDTTRKLRFIIESHLVKREAQRLVVNYKYSAIESPATFL